MYDLVYIDRTADHVTTVPNHNHVLWELFYVRTGGESNPPSRRGAS